MRSRSAPLLAALAALALAAPAQGADYVGLGDSYSSGTGTADSYSDDCERNNLAYPALIGPSLPGTDVNLSCSGARTQNITTDAQSGNPIPQIDIAGGLGPDTDFVTLEIGGNDAGFVDTLISCGNPFGNCHDAVEASKETAETELPPKLNATYAAVRAKAPNAIIAIVGYPRIFRPNQSCNTFFSASEVNELNGAADLLDELIKGIAHQRDLAYIDPRDAFITHGACDSVEWLNGLGTSNGFGNSYHPKAVGHANGYAPVVLAGIQNIPDTTIPTKPSSPSNSTSPQFGLASTVGGSTFQCKLDAGTYTACASPKQYTGVGQGSHTLVVRAVNSAGNVDQTPASYNWTIDTTPPVVTIAPSGPTGTVATGDAEFAFSTSDGTLECKLDTASFAPCASPRGYTDLEDGEHTFSVRATDTAGNAGTASRTWRVDTTAPEAAISLGPSNPTPDGGASFEFALDDPGAQAECRLDSADFAPCDSPQDLSGLPDGPHTFQVRGVDAVGNTGAPASYSWTIDQSSFPVSITSAPPALGNQTTADFAFESDDPTPPPLLVFDCKLDDQAFAACTTDSSAHYAGLGDGEHTFTVRTTKLGSIVATDSQGFTIDTAAPDTSIGSGPPALTQQTSAQLEFGSEDTDATFECRLDSTSPAAWNACTSPQSPSALSEGPHTFQVRAVDAAGNTDTSAATRTWTVDTTAPTPQITSQPAGSTNQRTAQFGFAAPPNETGLSYECRLDSSVPTEFQPCSSGQGYSDLGDGSHTFELRATDAAGNTTGVPVSHSWTIDATPPTVTIDDHPEDPQTSHSDSVAFHASEPGSSFECRLDSTVEPDFFSCVSPRQLNGLGEGAHVFEVRATDALHNRGPVTTYAWRVDTLTPTVTITSGPSTSSPVSNRNASFAFSLGAAEEEVYFECKLDTGAYELCTTPQEYGEEDLPDGQHTFVVRATDSAGHTATDSRTWTVDATPPVVTIASGPSGVTSSPLAAFGFTTSGGDVTQCKLDDEAFRACSTSNSDSRVLGDGDHTFTVRSTDAAGNEASASRAWTIDLTAPQTVIDSGPSGTTASTSAAFTFSADEPGAFLCSLDGAAFAACSPPHPVSGLAEGGHTFRVRAVDAAGNSDPTPAARSWTVALPQQPQVQGQVGAGAANKPKCKKAKKRAAGKSAKKRCKKRKKK